MKLFKVTNTTKRQVDQNKQNTNHFFQDDGEYGDFDYYEEINNTTVAIVTWDTADVLYVIELDRKDKCQLNDNKGYICSSGKKYVFGFETALFDVSDTENMQEFLTNFESNKRASLENLLTTFGVVKAIVLQ